MTSYSPEGLAEYWECGTRKCEAHARKLEATVRKWKTRDNTRAVTMVAYEWQTVAEDLEGCAHAIEKHYLSNLLAEVQSRRGETFEWLNKAHDNETVVRSREACEAATRKIEAKAQKWEGKVNDLRASAQLWKDKASALLGDPKAHGRLREIEVREWEEKASELKAGAQKLRAISGKWAEKAQELEDQSREAAAKAGALRNGN